MGTTPTLSLRGRVAAVPASSAMSRNELDPLIVTLASTAVLVEGTRRGDLEDMQGAAREPARIEDGGRWADGRG